MAIYISDPDSDYSHIMALCIDGGMVFVVRCMFCVFIYFVFIDVARFFGEKERQESWMKRLLGILELKHII